MLRKTLLCTTSPLPWFRLGRFAVVLILVLATLTACGSDSEGEGDNASEAESVAPDVATILANASARVAATQSLAFTLEVTGTTKIDDAGSIQLLGARGRLARPNLVDVQFQIRLLGAQTVSIRMITAGSDSWTTDLISGNWGPAPEEFGYDPSKLFDTENGLGPVMGKVTNPELMSADTVSGRDVWHIRGTVTQDIIGPVTAETMHGASVGLDLWIAQDNADLLKVELHEPTDAGLDDPAIWVMELGAQNEPVTIEPPI